MRFIKTEPHAVHAHRSLHTASPIRALMWRWRWVALALAISVAAQSVISLLSEQNPATTQIVVAAADLSTGDELTQADIKIANLPKKFLPEGTIDSPESVIGKRIVAPLPSGAPVLSQQLFTSAFAANPPKGTVITGISLDDPITLSILQPGDSIQLYAPPSQTDESTEAQLLTRFATVVAVESSNAQKNILNTSHTTGNIYVAIPENDTNAIIAFSANNSLHAVINSQ